MSDSSEQKTDPASDRKLRKQREDGNTPNTSEIVSSVGGFCAIIALILTAKYSLSLFDQQFSVAVQPEDQNFKARLESAITLSTTILSWTVLPIAMVTAFASFIATVLYLKGIVFTVKPLAPKFSRINPVSGLKRIYGKRGWIETGVGFSRAIIWFTCVGAVAWSLSADILGSFICGVPCIVTVSFELTWRILMFAMLIFLITALVDSIVQKFVYLDENKMTKTETKKEQKEQNGTPEIASARKNKRREILESSNKVGINKANMYFYTKDAFVGLLYHPKNEPVPRVVAKALNEKDVRILLNKANKLGLPGMVHQAVVEGIRVTAIGDRINEKMFEPTAEAMGKLFS